MGEILGLGITHYPPLCYKGNLTSRIKLLLKDPGLPERLRTSEGRRAALRPAHRRNCASTDIADTLAHGHR